MAGDLADKAFVQGTTGNNDIRATNDTDGSYLFARAGDDILRGGRYDDVLTGGAGDDLLFGGAGADQFRFFGNDIGGSSDLDKIFDLNFSEGDTLVFGKYGSALFTDSAGANASPDGLGVSISSYAGLAAQINNAGGAITYSEKGTTDVLILTLTNSTGQQQVIHITGGYDALLAELGTPA